VIKKERNMVNVDDMLPKKQMQARQLLGRTKRLMLSARNKELAQLHISSNQALLLWVIYHHNFDHPGHKITLTELAKESDREKNTISLQMTAMEKDGLVKKIREVPKSNKLSFDLTEKGLDAFNQSKDFKIDKAIMSVLSKEELKMLMALLNKIIKKAKQYQ
jgi:DNA-binding MarR family transcriptional regulator